jgi:predicted nucleotidyltransferase component of viral defense system
MIGLPEVQRIAYRSGVSERMIERDYILTWALIGLARHPIMGSSAALKGGTALKKLYFTDWRYSEDLDFTVQPVVAPDVLQGYLTAAGRTVHDETGIEFEVMSSEPRWDGPTLRNVTFYLGYVGPLHRTRRWRELKLDFTFDEVLINPPTRRPLLSTYSDEPRPAVLVQVYALEELCAEKLRTLLQRTQPRDLYDVWRIMSEQADALNLSALAAIFDAKCRHKNLSPNTLTQILVPTQVEKLRRAWQTSFADQMIDVPPLDQVARETQRALRSYLAL